MRMASATPAPSSVRRLCAGMNALDRLWTNPATRNVHWFRSGSRKSLTRKAEGRIIRHEEVPRNVFAFVALSAGIINAQWCVFGSFNNKGFLQYALCTHPLSGIVVRPTLVKLTTAIAIVMARVLSHSVFTKNPAATILGAGDCWTHDRTDTTKGSQ